MRRLILGTVVFISAAAVLVLEILAARILAPQVGVTLGTFSGIIGTILAAIAAGAWGGGKLADRHDPARLLGPVLIVGGLLAVASPTALTMLPDSWFGERLFNVVLVATVGFFAPAAVLSMVTPIAAKIALLSTDQTGRVVGNLSAIATVGAIFGTFVTGFFLVATFPSRPITWIVGGVLVTAGGLLSLAGGRRLALGGLALLAATIAASDGAASRCQVETAYYCASVHPDVARPSGRHLILDTLRHGYVDLDDRTHLEIRVIRTMAHALEALNQSAGHGLYIGGGAFVLPQYFQETTQASSTVLELDPTLVALAERRLGLAPGPWLDVRVGDARVTLRELPDDSADFAVGDAYGGPTVPWHLATLEYTLQIRRVLRPSGVYVMNVVDFAPAQFIRAEAATLGRAFKHVALVATPALLDTTDGGNYVLLASDAELDHNAVARAMTDGEVVVAGELLRAFVGSAPVLTDEFAPVDQLLGRP